MSSATFLNLGSPVRNPAMYTGASRNISVLLVSPEERAERSVPEPTGPGTGTGWAPQSPSGTRPATRHLVPVDSHARRRHLWMREGAPAALCEKMRGAHRPSAPVRRQPARTVRLCGHV